MTEAKKETAPVVDVKQLDGRNRVSISDEIAKAAGVTSSDFLKVTYDVTLKAIVLKPMALVEKV